MIGLAHTCDISRTQTLGTNGRRQMAALYTGIDCLFLPMSTRTSIDNGFSLGKGFDVYFEDGQDVKVGDKLVYTGSSFAVRYIQPFSGLAGGVSHIRALVEQELA